MQSEDPEEEIFIRLGSSGGEGEGEQGGSSSPPWEASLQFRAFCGGPSCGFGGFGSSGTGCNGTASVVRCCQVEEGNLTSGGCQVKTTFAGLASCHEEKQFLQGACTSLSGGCSGAAHSVECCNYHLDGKRMYPEEPLTSWSVDGFFPSCMDGRLPVGRRTSADRCAGCTVESTYQFTTLECAVVAVVLVEILVPASKISKVLKKAHDDPSSGHLGQTRTRDRPRGRAFWFSLQKVEILVPASKISKVLKKAHDDPSSGHLCQTKTRDRLRGKLDAAAKKEKMEYDSHHHIGTPWRVGDFVRVRNHKVQRGQSQKLTQKYSGNIYRVVRTSNNTVLIEGHLLDPEASGADSEAEPTRIESESDQPYHCLVHWEYEFTPDSHGNDGVSHALAGDDLSGATLWGVPTWPEARKGTGEGVLRGHCGGRVSPARVVVQPVAMIGPRPDLEPGFCVFALLDQAGALSNASH
ncbi:unnamed protein product [Darwinula stevensoni]|uniref:Integrase zinc-binding domain-containing protein n=1 Tax=Darwinula stevensoni TaxID=69355 RepID=A0A7R9FSD3_9CRUS|nr:unnamed protein product [Darwinula stevensoni]CAG0903305.1 unnamed protein product [Darwinula stevensoni]